MEEYTLTYEKSRSQEIHIENIGSVEFLYFDEEYKEARKLIKEIINLQCDENMTKYGCNNRILFVGQRGCGKTSVIRSLADYLYPDESKIPTDDDGKPFNNKFYCLPMVDPSHFDDNNDILLTVITKMFSEAKNKMKKNSDKDDSGKREELLRQFETVFKSLNALKSKVESYTLENLNNKSDAEDLRDKMKKLISKYLEYVRGDNKAKMILLIDDIDMTVYHAPTMLEQLRKYLELDNLIILMSANLEQLYNEMREHYSSAFKHTLNDDKQSLSLDVEDMATKYLLKLFPTSRRINVERQVSQLLKTNLKNGENDKGSNLQKVILSTIWRKTRLLFIPKENTLHPIIPTNLRDLAQFLDMLEVLPDVNHEGNKLFPDKAAYEQCEKNLQDFKNYVMRTWIPNHLSAEEEKVFENIPTDITEINKHLINAINVIGNEHKKRLMLREVSLEMIERNTEDVNINRDIYTMVSPNDPRFVKANKISDIFNQPSNYSYGDLLLMIDKYETYFESEKDRRFTDAIKIYYSILLFDTMFFKSNNVIYDWAKYNEGKNKGNDMIIPIQKLIGGTVYYPNYFEIITDKHFNQKGPSYDAKRAFYHKIKVDKKDKVGEKYPLFSVLYYGDIRPDRYDKKHIYDTTYNIDADVDGEKYVTFDILPVLNNMLNPCHTLNRLDNEKKRPEKWRNSDSLKDWNIVNKIDDKTIVPNAILPFYAVDLMLCYLRKEYKVSDICSGLPKMDTLAKIANNYCDIFEFVSTNKMKSVDKKDVSTNEESTCENPQQSTKNDVDEPESIIKRIISNPACFTGDNTIEKKKLEKNIRMILEENLCSERYFSNNRIEELWLNICKNDEDSIKRIINDCPEISRDENKSIIAGIIELSKTIKELMDFTKQQEKSREIEEMLLNMQEKINKRESIYFGQLEKYLIGEDNITELSDCFANKKFACFSECIEKLNVSNTVKELLKKGVANQAGQHFQTTLRKNTLVYADDEQLNKITGLVDCYNKGRALEVLLSRTTQPLFTDEKQIKTISKLSVVISHAYLCYMRISKECHGKCVDKEATSITELYKNHVISFVYGIEESCMSKKEKESLVKEIHKFSTVSEIFKHIVEKLWRDRITEMCIRGALQVEVHSQNVVSAYYTKLWDLTRIALSAIDDEFSKESPNANIKTVYEAIFDIAKKTFLQ